MAYYTIQEDRILKAQTREALTVYYDNVLPLPNDYNPIKYIIQEGQLVLNPNYEEDMAEIEKNRIARLSLTKREVFLALYNARGITPEQIKASITDPQALIEFEYANEYYRFNPLIDQVGAMLGFTSEDIDYLFIHKQFPTTYMLH